MAIRRYTDSDWQAVREIYDLSKPDEMRGMVDLSAVLPLSQDPSGLALFRESTILVAEHGTRVVGFAGHKGNYISWLFVHPRCRRQGIARELLQEMMRRLEGPVTLNVGAGNHAARCLYAAAGFTVARQFTGKFNGHDVDVLTLKYEPAG